MIWKALLALVVLGLPALQTQAEEPALSKIRKPLKGLGSILVVVEGLGPHAAKAGLSENELKTIVELRLRQSGVAVHDTDQQMLEPTVQQMLEPTVLYIGVCLQYMERIDFILFTSDVQLMQKVRLLRNGEVMATTWHSDRSLELHPTETVGDKIKKSLDSHLAQFLNDYLAANPKAEK